MTVVGETRTRSFRPSLRRLLLAVLVGLTLGFGAYILTSMQPSVAYLGFCHPGIAQGFDPWTGEPHGSTLNCEPSGVIPQTAPTTIQTPTPPDLASRQAIPVPLGFLLGAGLVLLTPVLRRSTRSSNFNETAGADEPTAAR
jgi:hypothetical protein